MSPVKERYAAEEIQALLEIFDGTNGDMWASSLASSAAESRTIRDRLEKKERDGEVIIKVDEKTDTKRYFHTSKQHAFDRCVPLSVRRPGGRYVCLSVSAHTLTGLFPAL